MHGNVREWCEDWYGVYSSVAVIDPRGPTKGFARVERGSSFYASDDDEDARSSRRYSSTPANKGSDLGFRLARDP